MDWENWMAVRIDGDLFECTPVEIEKDGTQTIVLGMCLVTSLDGLTERPEVKRVVEVTNTFEPEVIGRLYWTEDLPNHSSP